jgi:hypothetical protein
LGVCCAFAMRAVGSTIAEVTQIAASLEILFMVSPCHTRLKFRTALPLPDDREIPALCSVRLAKSNT